MNTEQVTALRRTILDAAMPSEQNVQEILNNPIRRLNLIACRAKGLSASKRSTERGRRHPWRRGNLQHYDNVFILCPSADWVASLPYGKIPDRKDFACLEDKERIRYWGEVIKRSEELAVKLDDLRSGNIGQYLVNNR